MKKIILASASPRRDEILNLAGLRHEIKASGADETPPRGASPADAVRLLSFRKAKAASAECGPEDIIIAADTTVELDGRMLGKPKGAEDARRMLRALSDKEHYVHTGITVMCREKTVSETVTTKVRMRKIEEEELEGYIDSGEPMDKAGAYGIQGLGGIFVSRLEGDYFNVMGLPLCRLCEILRTLGVTPFNKQ